MRLCENCIFRIKVQVCEKYAILAKSHFFGYFTINRYAYIVFPPLQGWHAIGILPLWYVYGGIW